MNQVTSIKRERAKLWIQRLPGADTLVDLIALQHATMELEVLGVCHAPVQGFTGAPGADLRYVISTTPPGIYYLSGMDNLEARVGGPGIRDEIQLLFIEHPTPSQQAHYLAGEIGFEVFDGPDVLHVTEDVKNRFVMIVSVMIRRK